MDWSIYWRAEQGWRLFICKAALLLLYFVGLPAVGWPGWYYLAPFSAPLALGLGVMWYGLVILAYASRYLRRAFASLTGKTRLGRMRQLLDEMGRTYDLLAGPVMHVDKVRSAFERAMEKGVLWDQEVFYILDRLAKQSPEVWMNYAPYSRPKS